MTASPATSGTKEPPEAGSHQNPGENAAECAEMPAQVKCRWHIQDDQDQGEEPN